MPRHLFENDAYFEVFVNTSIELAEAQDQKGVCTKAKAELLKKFLDINSPHELQKAPYLTDHRQTCSVEEIMTEIVDKSDIQYT